MVKAVASCCAKENPLLFSFCLRQLFFALTADPPSRARQPLPARGGRRHADAHAGVLQREVAPPRLLVARDGTPTLPWSCVPSTRLKQQMQMQQSMYNQYGMMFPPVKPQHPVLRQRACRTGVYP